jgi:mycofactocin system FadH/OYE family oxidoreductase 2
MYERLFSPLAIGPRELRNRIIFGSHTTNLARHNLLSEQHTQYYTARAEGGAGMIVLEEHIVHASDLPYESAVLGYLSGIQETLASVAKRIAAHGALTVVQLNHNGQQSSSEHHQHELLAPSPVADVASREVPKAMELSDIRAVIDGFAQVARTAQQAGADGVELQCSDRSLLRQFLSPLTNQRTDSYGGTLEHRLRFVQETLEAVDAALGPQSLLGLRFCADELAPWAGLTPEQSVEIVHLLASTKRIDYITVTMGSIFSTHMFPFHASMHVSPTYAAHLAALIKAAVNIPVFAAGRIMNAAQAERLLAEGQADGVEMIRALIADPDLPRLSQAGEVERVRPCIACNQGCQVRNVMNVAISCNVNPDVLHRYAPTKEASSKQTVVVIGGGPAGLEAARTAVLRGYNVVLYEREKTLGGTVALAARGPGRSALRLITDYLQAEIARLGVEVRTGVEVTADMVVAQRPHAVIVATGARTASGLLPIAGYDLPHVTDVRRVLSGEAVAGGRVVVVDESDSHGVMSAIELLASTGKHVEVVTEDWYVGHDLTGTHDIVSFMQRTLSQDVVFIPHSTVIRIEPTHVTIVDRFAEGERAIPAENVVLGTYERPAQELYLALKERLPRVLRAGDCVTPRRIEQAILEGRQAGKQV